MSILAFLEQRTTDQSAVIAAQKAYADKVSYWVIPTDNQPLAPTLAIQNRSSAPISKVTMGLAFRWVSGREVGESLDNINAGLIPPCSIVKTNLQGVLQGALSGLRKGRGLAVLSGFAPVGKDIRFWVSIPSMAFTDANGLTWIRSSNGQLATGPILPSYEGRIDHPLLGHSQVIQAPDALDLRAGVSRRSRSGHVRRPQAGPSGRPYSQKACSGLSYAAKTFCRRSDQPAPHAHK